jgi:hypothetical protein
VKGERREGRGEGKEGGDGRWEGGGRRGDDDEVAYHFLEAFFG